MTGTLMLVVPHQVRGFFHASLHPFLSVGGLLLFMAGLGLLGVAAVSSRNWLRKAAYLLAGAVLVFRAYQYTITLGFYIWTVHNFLLGVGAILVPLLAARAKRGTQGREIDLFALLMGFSLVVNSTVLLYPPPQSQEMLTAVQPYMAWYIGAFLAGGLALLTCQFHPAPPRWLVLAGHALAGASLITWIAPYARVVPWVGFLFYGGLGIALALLPWLSPRISGIDMASSRARLAVLLVASSILPLFALAVLIAFHQERIAVAQAFELQESMAADVSRDVEDFVGLHRAAVLALAARTQLVELASVRQRRALESLHREYPAIVDLSISDAAGLPLARSGNLPRMSHAEDPVFLELRRTREASVTLRMGPEAKRPVIVIAAPVQDENGAFAGMVRAGIDSRRLAELIGSPATSLRAETYILDQAGRVVAHPNEFLVASQADLSAHLPVSEFRKAGALGPSSSRSIRHTASNKNLLASYSRIPKLDWMVVIHRPEAIALENLRNQSDLIFATLVAMIAVAAVVGAAAAKRFTQPLEVLASAAKRLAQGGAALPLQPSRVTEIDRLNSGFEEMRDRLTLRTAERDRAEAELQRANSGLEARVRERTAELASANAQLQKEVAERQHAEYDLRRVNDTLRALVACSPLPIMATDCDGLVTNWNPAAERVFGWTAGEIVGHSNPLVPEEKRAEYAALLEAARKGETPIDYETRRQTKDGRLLEVSVSLACIRDGAGTVKGVLAIIAEIGERKRMEEHIRETQKRESVGLLAGGIAHDFNNLLTGIMGPASLLSDMVSPDARPLTDNIVRATERAADLTRQLLAYAGKGRFVVEPVDMSSLIREITSLIQASIPKKVQLQLALRDDLPPVETDASQMQQLVMNLVINAAEAIPSGKPGRVLVSTATHTMDLNFIATHFRGDRMTPGDFVCVEVHDTGCGMDPETVARIFDPFFTTKFTGRGLGLAAVGGIVRRHRGAIRVYSTPGMGTTFKVFLPASSGKRADPKEETQVEGDLRGAGMVLVVDDEEMVRGLAQKVLERHGYAVLTARDGQEAIDAFERQADGISLVLLDLTMPRMGGNEALGILKTIRPDIKVILSSGYNESEALRLFAGKDLAGFIQKPYTSARLAVKVKSVLGEARTGGASRE